MENKVSKRKDPNKCFMGAFQRIYIKCAKTKKVKNNQTKVVSEIFFK